MSARSASDASGRSFKVATTFWTLWIAAVTLMVSLTILTSGAFSRARTAARSGSSGTPLFSVEKMAQRTSGLVPSRQTTASATRMSADKAMKRDGRFLEQLGTVDPLTDPVTVKMKEDRVKYWIGVGALPSATVAQIIETQIPGYFSSIEKKRREQIVAARKKRKARAKGPKKEAAPKKKAAKK